MLNTNLFLSYSWKDSNLADEIDSKLSLMGFNVKRDIRDIGPWTSIKKFMEQIREQDYAILIISSSYLKSPNCMYEVIELLKDSSHSKKILSIVSPDLDIYNPITRAKYIKYWEDETKKLEEAIKPLKIENVSELSLELRKYKSIENTIASFLNIVSDKNNPQIIDAIDKIKEHLCKNMDSVADKKIEKQGEPLRINVEACHYAFLKFAAVTDVWGKEIEKMVGLKKLCNDVEEDVFDLPMLRCEIINCSKQKIVIKEPVLNGNIELNEDIINSISFMIKAEEEKVLKPGAKVEFVLHGKVIITIIKAFLNDEIKDIHVEDSFGFFYFATVTQIQEIKSYFQKYCSNLTELEERHNKYCL